MLYLIFDLGVISFISMERLITEVKTIILESIQNIEIEAENWRFFFKLLNKNLSELEFSNFQFELGSILFEHTDFEPDIIRCGTIIEIIFY